VDISPAREALAQAAAQKSGRWGTDALDAVLATAAVVHPLHPRARRRTAGLPMDPLPCPITIAWAEKDRILPVELCEAIARDRLPRATFTILPGLPHTPTIDDPELVASTILAVTGAEGAAAQGGDLDV